ncbi:replisome organizer [Streptococcus anginosus]|uniref:replisome organizer n=1 Tax=Streptococcus anginosus TaxID=1328 RepID=UPI000C7C3D29|nr:replisome organizer [Streptococcus anginosus]PLA01731.1 replisome organizer [Streptococcus anginosus]PLA05348.1 replisome organizer [Streptococcus anginosus]PLA55858.1 replisome organizer [Streptococcus anginosus]
MADKRMFSLKIVDSDLFLDMPLSSQCLYFHLSMRADDDGFVNNPKKIIKIIGANEDDLKILIAKGFVIVFDQGIIVITHWKINNYIRKDRYKPTMYIEQKQQLYQTENGAYISEEKVGCHLVNQRLSSGQPSIGKGRLDKVSIDKGREEQSTPIFYGEFKNVRLSKEEYKNLKEKLNSHTDIMINKLSRYMESSGKTYQNHYVTILKWYEEDKEKLRHQGVNKKMNYDVGESL